MPKVKGPQPWIVAIDIDDVLWPLNVTVTSRLGIKMEKLVDFHCYANPLLTLAQQEALTKAYNDPDVFCHMEFYDGVEKLLELEELGVRVEFHSNCYNEEVAFYKHANMFRAFPGIREDQLALKVISASQTKQKTLPRNLLLLVDDSPYNVAKSPAKVNVLPAWPYNGTEQAHAIMRGHDLCFVKPGDIPQLVEILRGLTIRLLGEYGPEPTPD